VTLDYDDVALASWLVDQAAAKPDARRLAAVFSAKGELQLVR